MPKAEQQAVVLKLPVALTSKSDCAHIFHELELLDESLKQAKFRQSSKAETPKLSRLLELLCKENGLDISATDERQRLMAFMKDLKSEAPVVHISFATEPSAVVSEKIVNWLRAEVHPLALLTIGLQPTIAAGCVIRVGSKYIDLSMRQHLQKSRSDLIARLRLDAA